jgi:hypothetical protein
MIDFSQTEKKLKDFAESCRIEDAFITDFCFDPTSLSARFVVACLDNDNTYQLAKGTVNSGYGNQEELSRKRMIIQDEAVRAKSQLWE